MIHIDACTYCLAQPKYFCYMKVFNENLDVFGSDESDIRFMT